MAADRQGELDAQVEAAIATRRAELTEGGTEWRFLCPSHGDANRPSAYWNRKNSVWNCRTCGAGGTTYELAELLGIEVKQKRSDARIIKTYDYTDADGRLVFQVVRMDPKDFRLRRPDPDKPDRWIWNRTGVTPMLYRLPTLKDVPPDEWVVVVEGEKDADTGARQGIKYITTAPFGAQEPTRTGKPGKPKWSQVYTEALRNQNVLLCYDADAAGQNSARQIALLLRPHTSRVVIMQLPGLPMVRDGLKFKDLTDWFAMGNTLEEFWEAAREAMTAPDLPPETPETTDDGDVILSYSETDAGNAELFAHLFGHLCRYDHQRGRWLVWGGQWWKADPDGQLTRWAIEMARKRQKAAADIDNRDAAKRAFTWAKSSESKGRIEAGLALAQSQPPIADPGKGWDANPFLLGVSNGVVNLTTGELRPGKQSDRITLNTGLPYDPNANAPRWMQFLDEVFEGSPQMLEFIQRAAGYSLTGSTKEQVYFLCHGKGANGKSTMLEVLAHCFGDYAGNLPFTALQKGKEQAIPTDLAALPGKRFITSSETQENSSLNEARIKALTGGDAITARELYQKQFTFVPELKLWVALNHLPNVSDASEGFWRRVRVVPFNRQFSPGERDADLRQKLLDELPGILAWAIQGATAWHQHGLKPPVAVMQNTVTYQHDSDPLDDFIRACCYVGENAHVMAGELYKGYSAWADRQGLRERDRMTATLFGRRISERYSKRRGAGGNSYQGIGLRAEGDSPDEDETLHGVQGFELEASEFSKSGSSDMPLRENSSNGVQTLHPLHSPLLPVCACSAKHEGAELPCPGGSWWWSADQPGDHCTICHTPPSEDTNE